MTIYINSFPLFTFKLKHKNRTLTCAYTNQGFAICLTGNYFSITENVKKENVKKENHEKINHKNHTYHCSCTNDSTAHQVVILKSICLRKYLIFNGLSDFMGRCLFECEGDREVFAGYLEEMNKK